MLITTSQLRHLALSHLSVLYGKGEHASARNCRAVAEKLELQTPAAGHKGEHHPCRVYMNGNTSIYGWQNIFHNMDISPFIYIWKYSTYGHIMTYIYIYYIMIYIYILYNYIYIWQTYLCCFLLSKK